MGTWGHKAFENDDALVWVDQFLKHPTPQGFLISSFDSILPTASSAGDRRAIAAAETVAKLRGHGARELPDDLRVWISENGFLPKAATARAASRAIKNIIQSSELLELWGGDKHWLATCRRLTERLERPAKKQKKKSKAKTNSPLTSGDSWKSQNEVVKYIRKQNGFVYFENRKPDIAGFDDNCKVSRKLLLAFSKLTTLNQLCLTDEPRFDPGWMFPLVTLSKLEHLSLEGPGIENGHLQVVDQHRPESFGVFSKGD